MQPDSPAKTGEKRRALRLPRFREAICVFNEGASSLDVTLRGISPTGARISGDELFCLPHTFELRLQDGVGGYSARTARIVWSNGATAGVEFID